MDRNKGQSSGPQANTFPGSTRDDLRRARAMNPHLFDEEMREYKRLLEEDDEIDESYRSFLCSFVNIEIFEPQEEETDNDNNDVFEHHQEGQQADEDNDVGEGSDVIWSSGDQIPCPEYELFLKHLKPHGKSYVLEYEKDGVPVSIKYEEPVRKPSGALGQDQPGISNQMPGSDNQGNNDQQSYHALEKNPVAEDPPRIHLPQDVKLEDDVDKGKAVVVYGENDIEVEGKEESDSDVEILDSAAIIQDETLTPFVPSKRYHESHLFGRSSANNEFRGKVLDVIGKPFDKEEYKSHQKAVKIYLDHHPDLQRKLKIYRYNRRKRLSILRGFFFWLQNLTREGSFKPWKDGQCLAVEAGSH